MGKKRQYKKKRYGRKRAENILTYSGPGLVQSTPLPKSFKFQTKYVDSSMFLDTGSGGVPVTKVYNLMSLYDPDYSGSGHKVLGFDQLMGMYDHYCVIGARVRVTATNTSTATPQTVILHIKDRAAVSTDIDQIIENGLCRWANLGTLDSGTSTKDLSINFSPNKYFTKRVLNEENYQGSLNSDPDETAYLHVTIHPLNAADEAPVRFTVEIEYIAILTEPKMLIGS